MIGDSDVPHRVLLPKKIWEQARDKEHLKRLIYEYIAKGYPDYRIKAVKDGFAICTK